MTNPSKNQIVIVLVINLFMLSASILGVIKWYDVSMVKALATTCSSAIFLFLIVSALREHYKLFC